MSDALDRLRRSPDPSLLEGTLVDALVGRRVRVQGRVFPDDFGLNVYPETLEGIEFDLDAAARRLAPRLEVGDRGAT